MPGYFKASEQVVTIEPSVSTYKPAVPRPGDEQQQKDVLPLVAATNSSQNALDSNENEKCDFTNKDTTEEVERDTEEKRDHDPIKIYLRDAAVGFLIGEYTIILNESDGNGI